jgi:hypothetical protein
VKLSDAQVAAVRSLEDKQGRVTPQQVLRAARAKTNPLHGLFDWNAKAAAEKWWLHQARLIIGAVTLVVETTEHRIARPVYVVDTEAEGAGYRAVSELKSDPESARSSLVYTLEVAAGHLRRAYDLAGPLGLSADVDALVHQILGLVQRAQGKKKAA